MRAHLSTLLALALLPPACIPPGPGEPPSILLVTVDTLRADHLGAYGYFRNTSPVLDALAEEAVLFERTVAPMATTLPAHVSLMTATNPGRHGIKGNFRHFRQPLVATDRLQTFAQMLTRAGYTTAAFVAATPLKAESGIAAGFQSFSQPESASLPARQIVERALRWLGEEQESPFFLWLHFWDPHFPYGPPARFRRIFADDVEEQRRFFVSRDYANPDDPEIQEINNAYDGEIRYVDRQLGRLFEEMRRGGRYDEIALVVTSDHGEGLGQHDWLYHGRIYNEQILVPLLIKLPAEYGMRGRQTRLASLIDVVPSLVEALDLPLGPRDRQQFEGINLLADRPARRFALAERVHREDDWEPGLKYALVGQEWKYFHLTEGDDELYRLIDDPHEGHNVIAEEPDIAHAMRARIQQMLADYAAQEPGLEASDDISPERLEELRSLGYVD